MKTIEDIALELHGDESAAVQLLYAFNSVGKTRLSVAYKNLTKDKDGTHTGIYYNAYSEDLFIWDNDIENAEANIRLTVRPSSLSRLHASLNEDVIREKLKPYRMNFDFHFNIHPNMEMGIDSISFFPVGAQFGEVPAMKISRGEERIFVWSFFLAMMEAGDWMKRQPSHIFIDDPVTSLNDHNIFVTASTLFDLMDKHLDKRKIIVATHHVGMFSILFNWLMKGEKSDRFKQKTKVNILSSKHGGVSLDNIRSDVFLYHLRVLQILEQAMQEEDVRVYHFALLRQVLESVSSFLGVGRISYVLKSIGFEDADEIARIVNTIAHKNFFLYESDLLVSDNRMLFEKIFEKLNTQYKFVIHAGRP